MFLKELKVNYKSLIIWILIASITYGAILYIYPSIIESMNVEQIDAMMASMPEAFLKTVNMDITSITSAFGWFKSEGMTFLLLITNCYACILGANIILKEESDKTYEFLLSKPITRNRVLTTKIMTGIIYISLLIIISGIFICISLGINESFDKSQFILLIASQFLSAIPSFLFLLLISLFFKKSKKIFGISIGVVFLNYFFSLISTISTKTENFKYLSLFTLSNIRNIVVNNTIEIKYVLFAIIFCIISIVLTYIIYNKKEFV